MNKTELLRRAKENAAHWLTAPFDTEVQAEVKEMMEREEANFIDAFYKNLSFGTGGMRGIMRTGTNGINAYTLSLATQALCTYLRSLYSKPKMKIAIAYDCRYNSRELSEAIASVITSNDMDAYLFEALRPTPVLSFAVKHLECDAGIVITASHNPPKYNGYKIYWADGGQLIPPHDQGIISIYNTLSFSNICTKSSADGRLHTLKQDIDHAFVDTCISVLSPYKHVATGNDLSIVFTPLHGTSITVLPSLISKAGFGNIHIVEEQATPDGGFPTVDSPNPEEASAMKMAIEEAKKTDADILFGTDPDADRVGFGVKDKNGDWILLNGNEASALLTDFILSHLSEKELQNSFIVSTIVSSDITSDVAKLYDVEFSEVLTGFKWIADQIEQMPNKIFLCGSEESYGFLPADYVRDKDALGTALVFCYMAQWLKNKGTNPIDYLKDIHMRTFAYKERLVSISREGAEGEVYIKKVVDTWRNEPPSHLLGSKIVMIDDYQLSVRKNIVSGTEQRLNLPQSNVLVFRTEAGDKVCVRPSGTEPKIKFYFSVKQKVKTESEYNRVKHQLNERLDLLEEYFTMS